MTLICVSQRVEILPERNEVRDSIDQRLISFLSKSGAIVVPVPNFAHSEMEIENWLNNIRPRAIVLSGGNDIGEQPSRDHVEERLLNYGSRNSLPLLGICRGMQMMGVWGGAALKSVRGHVATRHQLMGELDVTVNSYHNYSLTAVPDKFKAIAYSEDGEIEAIQHTTLPWEGWMWHPEREIFFSKTDLKRFRNLIS